MTTIHCDFRGVWTNPLPQTCCACGKAPATGVISYAGKVHEPHCEECCKAWEVALLEGEASLRRMYGMTLHDFREWQADRRKA